MVEPTHACMIVLRLYDKRSLFNNGVSPIDFTQKGIADALGIRRNHAGVELNRLVGRGILKATDAWVKGVTGMRKVYTLTSAGLALAEVYAEVYSAELMERRVKEEEPESNWLLEMEMQMNEKRPAAPPKPEARDLSPPS